MTGAATLSLVIIVFVFALAFVRKRYVTHRPSWRTKVSRKSLETAEWLTSLVDRIVVFSRDEIRSAVHNSLHGALVDKAESSGIASDIKIEVRHLTELVPRVGAIDVVSMSPTTITIEVELEFSSNIELFASADVHVARGRKLPIEVCISDCRFGGHFLICVEWCGEGKEKEPTEPHATLLSRVSLKSEPSFRFALDTAVGHSYKLKNFFGFAVLAKHVIMRSLRGRLLSPKALSFNFSIPTLHLNDGWEETDNSSDFSDLGS